MRRLVTTRSVLWFVIDFIILALLLYIVPFTEGIMTIVKNIPNPLENIFYLLLNPWQYHTVMTIVLTIIIGVLGSLNMALVSYLRRSAVTKIPSASGSILGTVGFVAAALGSGCVACGSLVISSLLAYVGLGGIVLLLPFGGVELLWGGVLLLSATSYFLYRRVVSPRVCPL